MPNSVGVKNFVRCEKSGIAYMISNSMTEGKCTFDAVMRLVEKLSENEKFKVFYFDNDFTMVALLLELKRQGYTISRF